MDKQKYPQLLSLKNCFIRGSVVRYIQIPSGDVDTELLQDATRKENSTKVLKAFELGYKSLGTRLIYNLPLSPAS